MDNVFNGEGRKGKERKGKERKGKERKGKERKGKERKGKERKGKERKGKERKGKERKGKERKGKEGKERKGKEGKERKGKKRKRRGTELNGCKKHAVILALCWQTSFNGYDMIEIQLKISIKSIFISRGENAFPSAHSLSYGGEGKVSEAAIDRMVQDLGKQ